MGPVECIVQCIQMTRMYSRCNQDVFPNAILLIIITVQQNDYEISANPNPNPNPV